MEPEFHGREAELVDAVAALEDAECGALLVSGPAGIGKSRLLRAVVAAASARGYVVLRVTATEIERSLPLVTLQDVMDQLGHGVLDALPEHHRAVLSSALSGTATGGEAGKGAVALATRALLAAAAAEHPTLVAVDDLPWVDRASLVALTYATRRVSSSRLMLVATVRDPVPDELAALGRCLPLGPLDQDAGVHLVRDELGPDVAYPFAVRLQRAAEGNPLLIRELARAVDAEGRWGSERVSELVPTGDLIASVSARVAGLPVVVREVLAHAAALARPTPGLLEAACGPDASRHLALAAQAGLVRAVGGRVHFTHPLYAAALLGALGPVARRGVHHHLSALPLVEEERAWHLARGAAGPDADVAAVVEAAARTARRRGAPDQAAELAELAGDLTPPEGGAERSRRRRLVAAALTDAGDLVRAKQVLEELLEEQVRGADRATTLIALSEVLYELDGPATAGPAANRALAEADGDPGVAAAAHLALVDRSHADSVTRMTHARQALTLLEQEPDADTSLQAQAYREVAIAGFHLGQGMPAEIHRAIEIEQGLTDPPPVAWRASTCYAQCIKYLDGLGQAELLLRRSQQDAEEGGDLASLVDVLGHRAELALWLGDVPEGSALAERAWALAEDLGQGGRAGIAASFAVLAAAVRGDLSRGHEIGHAVTTRFPDQDPWSAAMLAHALGRLELWCGEVRTARTRLQVCDDLATSVDLSVPRQWRYLGDYVESLAGSGELDLAEERLAVMRRWAESMGLASSVGLASRAAGILAEARHDPEQAVTALASSVASFEAAGMPMHAARTRLSLGRVLRTARHRRRAREILEEAARALDGMGAEGWAMQARTELARVSGRAVASGLTPTEQQVADLVAEGLSNKEVAARLSVTVRTVEAHLTRVYAKLGVRSRAALAARTH